MADTGWKNPTASANLQDSSSESVSYPPKGQWASTSNVYTSNNSYATTTLDNIWSGDWLIAKHFDMGLTDCLPTIIEVGVEAHSDLTANSLWIYTTYNGTDPVDDIGYYNMTTSDAYYGTLITPALTVAQVNSDNFGIMVRPKANYGLGVVSNFYVDHIRVKVYYTPLTITTTALTGWTINTAYSQTVTANISGCTWDITSGTLPTNLSLNGSTGAITGTPTVAETKTFTIRATGPLGGTTTKSFTITILAAMTDTVSSVSEGIAIVTANRPINVLPNSKAYVLNNVSDLLSGAEPVWSYISSAPFSSLIYLDTLKQMWGARRNAGNISVLEAGGNEGGISWEFDTGYFDFGEFDEIKAMKEIAAQAQKQYREFQALVKSNGNFALTVYTEDDADTGTIIDIMPSDVGMSVYNSLKTALSRDIRGVYVRFKFTGTVDFWIGKMAIRMTAKGHR